RNPWYRDIAVDELAYLQGEGRAKLERQFGSEFHQGLVDTWEKMIVVLKTGEHCPHHLRGQKPD
ncbi:MAG: SAM-dependent methyltransferase, partial [Alphaproteobacteria bacterium]